MAALSRLHQHSTDTNTSASGLTRKLFQRFRQCLADEERFCRTLVLRIQRTYARSLSFPDAMSELAAPPSELLWCWSSGAELQKTTGEEEQAMASHFGFLPASAMTTAEGE
jgi:hypothetical protein